MSDYEIAALTENEEIALKIISSKIGKVFKLLLEGTPYINTVYTGVIGNLEKKNLLLSINEMIDRKIDEKLNINNTEEMDLFTHVIFKSLRCSKSGQVKRIIDILQGKYDGNIQSFNDAEDLINIVSELSENEAKCLVEVYAVFGKMPEPTKVNEEKGIKDYGRGTIHGVSENQRVFLLNRLAGKGLVRVSVQQNSVYKNSSRRCILRI